MDQQRSQRFSRTSRLLTSDDYRRVFQMAERWHDSCFTVLASRSSRTGARLGLAIARKHVRRAVDRNRIKRVIRESFRIHRDGLQGYDLVVLAKSGTVHQSNARLSASLQKHWRHITVSH